MKFSPKRIITLMALLAPLSSHAFESGSTGVDGAFNPTTDIELAMPPSGIFNFTTVTIPADVTVTFAKNAANTPVTILASGNVTIDGVINVNGANSPATNDADTVGDAEGGQGGPGGYDGGRGGYYSTSTASNDDGANGYGPGGGGRATDGNSCSAYAGAGGGYGTAGVGSAYGSPQSGVAYGQIHLIPLLGGSGGGGGAGRTARLGSGGGGGGGALLIASSATLILNGSITANGGNSGSTGGGCGNNASGPGGGGSGGAVRLVATTLTGDGTISANGGVAANYTYSSSNYNSGGAGRIRLEADNMEYGRRSSPNASVAAASPIFVPNLPTIKIASVGGISAPSVPTGNSDIVLADNTPNPVDVTFATTNIPAGSTIKLIVTPLIGASITANSSAVAADGTATVSIDMPNGSSVLLATSTFTVTAALSESYSKYAKGESVEKVQVSFDTNGQSETTFITFSGNEYSWPSNSIALN
jgi:hypothetical protein